MRTRTSAEGTTNLSGIPSAGGGWVGVKNGKLFVLAVGKFSALVIVGKNVPYQQNMTSRPVLVFVLDAFSSELLSFLPLVPILEIALVSHTPGASVLLRIEI
jgi:hypothetical protein